MKLSTLQVRDVSLAYSNAEEDPRRGCIGHLRGDFGNGYGFWSVWFPHQKDAFNTPSFQQDLRTTINALRENVLRSLSRYQKVLLKSGLIGLLPLQVHRFYRPSNHLKTSRSE